MEWIVLGRRSQGERERECMCEKVDREMPKQTVAEAEDPT